MLHVVLRVYEHSTDSVLDDISQMAFYCRAIQAMEAASLPLLKTLLSSYNKLRKIKHSTTPKLSKEQLLQLCSAVEKVLDNAVTADATKTEAMTYMSTLLVAFLAFLLPQRTQVSSFCVFVLCSI